MSEPIPVEADPPIMQASLSAMPAGAPANTAARIGKNFSFRMAAQILIALINVAKMVMLGNYLSAVGYGEYVFYYALIPLIGSIGDLGSGVMITKSIARDRLMGARYYGDALMIKGAISVVILVGVAGSAWFMFDPLKAALITVVCATALIDFSQDVSVWILRAHERLDLEAALQLVNHVLWFALIWIGIWLHVSLTWLVSCALAAFLVRVGLGVWMVHRQFYRPVFEFDWARLRAFVIQALPFGLAMFVVVLYGRIGVLMLQALASKTDVALFNVGYMLSQPLGFISTALSMAAFPTLARRALRGHDVLASALRRTSKYQLVVTLPLMVGLFMLAQRVIPLLFHGTDFARAGFTLKLMSLGLTFIFINLMSRYVLAAIDLQKVYLQAVIVGLIVNVGVGAALIPSQGFAGACYALLGGEAAILVMCQRALSKYVPVTQLLGYLVRPGIAALGMAAVVWGIRGANLAVVVTGGAVAYVTLLFLVRAFTPDELRLMRGMLSSFGIPGMAAARPAEPRS